MTKRRWAPIAAGVAIFVVFICLGIAALAIGWMRQHVQETPATVEEALRAIAAVHARFPGKSPMVEMRDGLLVVRPKPAAAAVPAPSSLSRLYLIAWDPRKARITRFEMPFWVLRLKPTAFRLGNVAVGLDDSSMQVRPDDIERNGPGVVFDLVTPGGQRALLWAE